jgi:hypothetical protein
MGLLGSFQGGRWCRGVEEQSDEPPLIIERQPDDVCSFECSARGFVGGRHNKIAEAAAFQLGRLLDDGQDLGGNPCLDPSGSPLFKWHQAPALPSFLSMYGFIPDILKT